MRRRAARRSRELRLLITTLLITTVPLLSACSSGDGSGGERATGSPADEHGDDQGGTRGTVDLEPSFAATTTTPEDRALAALVLRDAPLPGFEGADDVLGAGPLDLEAAAAAEVDAPAERALLETRRFERGVSRAWIDPGQDVVYLAVYDFADAEGAAAYLGDGAETLRGRGATTFEVPEVEGAIGFTTIEESPEGSFTAHAVAFTRGDLWVLALVGSPSSGRTPDDARAVAASQAARL